jgi:hypothetical protein
MSGSGGRRWPVAAGCPGPVNKHAHDGTHKCGPHCDQGDLPARHVASDAVEGVDRGPEPDDRGGRAWRGYGPVAAKAAGAAAMAAARAAASPARMQARRRMVRMGFMAISVGVWLR